MSSSDRIPHTDTSASTSEGASASEHSVSTTVEKPPTAGALAPPAERKRDKHLYQIDFFRLVTFAGVILDHVMLNAASATNVAAGGVELFLRYTRYGFFTLTGFVLTYQYRNRELKPLTFWRRRYKLIGLPFLMWSLFYWFFIKWQHGGFHEIIDNFSSGPAIRLALKSLGYDIVTGTAYYHLYFLSVSMQIYAIYPLLLWVLRKSRGYHRYLLAISLAVHCLLIYGMVRPPLDFFTHGFPGLVWRYLPITILPYQFFVVLGSLAAMHYEAFQRIILRMRWYVLVVGAAVMGVTLWYFFHILDRGEEMFRATNVFMLHNAWAYMSVIAMLYCVGTFWLERRRAGSVADKFIKTAADRSFAVYLAHALALSVVQTTALQRWEVLPGYKIIVIFAVTIALTVLIVEVLRRSPISLITTGRSALSWREQNPVVGGAVAAALLIIGFVLRSTDESLLGTLFAAIGVILAATCVYVAVKKYTAESTDTPTDKASV